MIFNRPRRQEKKRLKWYFNEYVDIYLQKNFQVEFNSNGVSWNTISIGVTPFASYLRYINTATGSSSFVYNPSSKWANEAYRTITFEEEPTGDLLTWLQSNATPQ